jgi:hypothetical protein
MFDEEYELWSSSTLNLLLRPVTIFPTVPNVPEHLVIKHAQFVFYLSTPTEANHGCKYYTN